MLLLQGLKNPVACRPAKCAILEEERGALSNADGRKIGRPQAKERPRDAAHCLQTEISVQSVEPGGEISAVLTGRPIGIGDALSVGDKTRRAEKERFDVTVVVDPSEEKIKSEFAGVKRTYLPMHSILRIDEVEKQGASKISKLEGGNVAQFPVPIYTPGGENKS